MGAMNLGQASPYIEAFAMAKGAARTIFHIIDRYNNFFAFLKRDRFPRNTCGPQTIILENG